MFVALCTLPIPTSRRRHLYIEYAHLLFLLHGHMSCHMSCNMCHVSFVMCHMSCVMCNVSCVMFHVSCLMRHVMSCHVMSYHVNTSYLSSCACRCIYVASLSCSFSRFFVLLFCFFTYLRVRACMRALAGWPLRKHKRCFCRCGSRTRD